MKKVYWDQTGLTGCVGIIGTGAEIIPAGTTICSMSVRDKGGEYQKFADEYDIHFIFEDDIPKPDFYTVPQVDIMATDSDGGYIGTVGRGCDFTSDAPICYISNQKECFLVAGNGAEFLEKAASWKSQMLPYENIRFFHSREEAQQELEFIEMPRLDIPEPSL